MPPQNLNKVMAKKNTGKPAQKTEEAAVAQALSKSEEFFAKNRKLITIILLAIVVVVCLIFAYMKWIREPRRQEALGQLFPAEQYFRIDSFDLALNGDGNALGFKEIINQYKALPGKVVYFYAGVCELQLGNYQEAINYLAKFHANDDIIQARAFCNLGDAYVGLNNNQKALTYYLKAANYKDNAYAAYYYKKAGLMYEELGDKANALSTYQTIKNKYPQTLEAYEIDKYISRLQIAQ